MELLIFILPVAALWFLLLRPQQKKARERATAIASVKEGDEVVTIGGFIALVTELDVNGDTDLVRLELAEGVEVLASRRAIGEVRPFVETDETADTTVASPGAIAAGTGADETGSAEDENGAARATAPEGHGPAAHDSGVGDVAAGADGENADRD
jgi:preprotein translocase subunit YajC